MNILSINIFKISQVLYQLLFDLLLCHELAAPIGRLDCIVYPTFPFTRCPVGSTGIHQELTCPDTIRKKLVPLNVTSWAEQGPKAPHLPIPGLRERGSTIFTIHHPVYQEVMELERCSRFRRRWGCVLLLYLSSFPLPSGFGQVFGQGLGLYLNSFFMQFFDNLLCVEAALLHALQCWGQG